MSRQSNTAPEIVVLLRRLRGRPGHVYADGVVGQCEGAALAAALSLREELAATVTAVAVGPAIREDRVLAMALRAGADRAVRVFDNQLDTLDFLGIAQVLAKTLAHLEYGLIVCGDRSQDEVQGAIGPAVAELLGVPHLTGLMDVRAEDGLLIARRRAEGNLDSFLCDPPAVLCIREFPRNPQRLVSAVRREKEQDEDPEWHRRSTVSVRPGAIEELDLEDLKIDRETIVERRRFLGKARGRGRQRKVNMLPDPRSLVARLVDDEIL